MSECEHPVRREPFLNAPLSVLRFGFNFHYRSLAAYVPGLRGLDVVEIDKAEFLLCDLFEIDDVQTIWPAALQPCELSTNQQKRDDGHTNTDTDSEKSPSEWQEKKNGNGDPEDQACDYQHDHFRVRQAPENDRLFNEPVWDEVDFSTLHTDLFH